MAASLRQWGRRIDAVAPAEEAERIYRALAQDNPAFLPDLAGALINLGAFYSETGRRGDAIAPAEEAERTYRALAQDNPAFLPDLAMTLNNLGIRYSETGRPGDAIAPTEEAERTYRALARDNPAFLPDLARALNNLAAYYREAGAAERGDAAWDEAIADLAGSYAAYLLAARATAEPGDPRSTEWVVNALRLADERDRGLTSHIHDQAREQWRADRERLAAFWQLHADDPLPEWLLVDARLLASAREWIATPTYTAERDFLASHPELLGSGADVAVREALLAVGAEDAERYESLRQQARTSGAESAYRPLLLTLLGREFADADAETQRLLLANRRDELLTETVRDVLSEMAGQGDDNAHRALALLALAALGEHVAVFEALEDPPSMAALLHSYAARPDPALLAPTAAIAVGASTSPGELATALLYAAVAAEVAGNADQATNLVRKAQRLDPDQSLTWIRKLAEVGAQHPAALRLITELAGRQDDKPGGQS